MKADFNARWAEAPATLRREPSALELAGGFPCGPLDLPLWNELTYRLTQVYGELATVVRQSGQTPNQSNLGQVWQAILSVLPASVGLWHVGTTTRSGSTLTVASVTPPITAEADFLPCLIRVPSGVVAGDTLSISGLSGLLKRNDGSPIQTGDVPPDGEMLVNRHGSEWRLVGFGRTEVIIPRDSPTFYVRTDGSDGNDGSENSPTKAFRTLGALLNKAVSQYAFSQLNVRMGIPGTYESPGAIPVAAGKISIYGDQANQAGYVIQGAGSPGRGSIQAATSVDLIGLTVSNTGNQSHTLVATNGAQVACLNVDLRSLATTTGFHAYGSGGRVVFQTGCSIGGNAAAALWGEAGGEAAINPSTSLAVVGNPNFSTAFAVAIATGRVTALSGSSVAGSSTGNRYNAQSYGIINTNGGGPNFFPGDQAGFVSNALYL
ncbi:hypothetical protein FF100_04975 [Methylobacterium terricola]|uniref:Uncharacterized protein n=1 Tax=Methylobacterium terricola TaxID=2583531 RepID=A0A5C4LN97_9HYPH|nr:hypothetical protein [Methylobacterium terricola]TNC14931.1 hypothetical protein FF100_04975 [Methylobacterium terricola]